MNFAELSAQRYSLRKFSDRPVEDALLQQVLEAGRNAPTAHNNQPQRIFVLQSPEAMAKADACMGCHFHPPVLLAVAYDPAAAWDRECDGKNHGEIDASWTWGWRRQEKSVGCGANQGGFEAADESAAGLYGHSTAYVGDRQCADSAY